MSRITTKQFVDVIQGKNLSTDEAHALIKKAYPESNMTREQVRVRLRSILRSPNAVVAQTGIGNKARYELISVTDQFLNYSDANYRTSGKRLKKNKTVWRFNHVELRYCHFHKMFDQALASVRGNANG